MEIVERLRSDLYAKPTFPIGARKNMLDAADEIERLRRRVDELEWLAEKADAEFDIAGKAVGLE